MVAQAESFDRFCNHMQGIARRRLGLAGIDVEQACNDGLLQYCQKYPEQADPEKVYPPNPLLTHIVYCRLLDQRRQDTALVAGERCSVKFLPNEAMAMHAVLPDSDDDDLQARRDSKREELLAQISVRLDAKNDITRDIFRLKDRLDWSSAEISECLGMSVNAIDCRYSRKKRELQKMKNNIDLQIN